MLAQVCCAEENGAASCPTWGHPGRSLCCFSPSFILACVLPGRAASHRGLWHPRHSLRLFLPPPRTLRDCEFFRSFSQQTDVKSRGGSSCSRLHRGNPCPPLRSFVSPVHRRWTCSHHPLLTLASPAPRSAAPTTFHESLRGATTKTTPQKLYLCWKRTYAKAADVGPSAVEQHRSSQQSSRPRESPVGPRRVLEGPEQGQQPHQPPQPWSGQHCPGTEPTALLSPRSALK